MNKAISNNIFTFKIQPDEQGGETKTVKITKDNFAENTGSSKKPPTAHLLIGFDTEYQALEENEEEGGVKQGAKNDLLSYQFSIKLFDKFSPDLQQEAEGIIIPDAGQRLTVEQFIGFAIGSLVEKCPAIVLPSTIYLLGHFIRADLPAFSDFQRVARSGLNNIRSTFVTLQNTLPMALTEEGVEIGKFQVTVRDTILLAPANAKSLADVGAILGFEKIQIGKTPEEDKHMKQNMRMVRTQHWDQFQEYAIRDAQICVRYAESLILQSDKLFDKFEMPTTLTSFGTKLLLQGWKSDKRDSLEILGREKIKDRRFSKKLGYFKTEDKTPLIEELHFEEAFVTESYHGGRNEQFLFGIGSEGTWRDHDLSSAYTTAMSLIGKAAWREIAHLNSLDEVDMLDLSFFSVDFEFPEHIRFPTLPVRTSSGIVFPRRGNSKCAAPELFLAKQLGANLRLRRAVKVPVDRSYRVFKDFITSSIQKRTEHPKGSFENLFWKEVGNSTYGKTAQGLREKRVYNLNADDMEGLPASKITQPYFASFITSFTRAVLGEILNGFSDKVKVFSVTTDGFLSNADDAEIGNATSGPIFTAFSEARKDLDQKSEALEVKHTIKQPIGWRTRGSATLKEGDAENGIVLQKGGIKTDVFNSPSEENREVVKLFLNRTPTQKMKYKTGVGIKEMMRGDTDFVFKSVEKRLSMEFDWKRTPLNEKEVTFEYQGKAYKHLTFDTIPIESLAAFDHVRGSWENYNKRQRHCLMSLADFKAFQTYQLTRRMPDQEATRYLRKKDGDIARLRRDVCRAFKHHNAGFDIMRSERRLRNHDICKALEAAGVPCKITDVENAKKKEFSPHQTPDTPGVRAALIRLKEEFPYLEIALFLPQGAMDETQKSSSVEN